MKLVGEIMIVFQAQNINKSFGDKEILKAVSLALNEKERVGMVGVNGSGKTTFLKCLTGELSLDKGIVSVSNMLSLAYLEQLPQQDENATAWDAVISSFSDLLEKRRQLGELEYKISLGGANIDKVMNRYAELTEEYERADGYACENMARRILKGLGFDSEQFLQPVNTFSGGQRTRLNLGRLLALNPDILLLDEPTNHLDMASVEWLEEYLGSYSGTVLVVSHDRMFLDKVTTRIVELKNGELCSFNGNYSSYIKQKALQEDALEHAYEKQQEYIKNTEDYIRRFKAGIKSKQARGRQSQLDRLERIEKPQMENSIGNWNIQMQCESARDVLTIKDVSKSYDNLNLLNRVNLSIQKGDKIALVGPNGSGKSTLLKIITERIKPDEGEFRTGSRVITAYFSQELEDLDDSHNVIEEIIYNFDINLEDARSLLGRMLFQGDDIYKPVADLSGGEKGRLSLLKIFLTGANFLILDEPTNHLDIKSRETVENMLASFPGTVLVVSHDRYFIDRVASRVVAIEDRLLEYYWGNYSYYHEKVQQKSSLIIKEKVTDKNNETEQQKFRNEQKEQQRLQKKLDRQFQHIEQKISEIEQRKLQLEEILANPDVYSGEQQAKNYIEEYEKVQAELTDLYDEWEIMAEQIEQREVDIS